MTEPGRGGGLFHGAQFELPAHEISATDDYPLPVDMPFNAGTSHFLCLDRHAEREAAFNGCLNN